MAQQEVAGAFGGHAAGDHLVHGLAHHVQQGGAHGLGQAGLQQRSMNDQYAQGMLGAQAGMSQAELAARMQRRRNASSVAAAAPTVVAATAPLALPAEPLLSPACPPSSPARATRWSRCARGIDMGQLRQLGVSQQVGLLFVLLFLLGWHSFGFVVHA